MKQLNQFKKIAGVVGMLTVNVFFVLPFVKKQYLKIYSNKSEITHIVIYKLKFKCFMDIKCNGKDIGRVDFGLFGKEAPKNINNFLHIISKTLDKPNYENTIFFKIVPKFIIQGGDITNNDGTGHYSILDNQYIEDEISKNLKFCEPGLLALANNGPNTNGSQFFITLDETNSLDNKYTIIGRVIKGYDKLKGISKLCGSIDGDSLCDVKISNTGIYKYQDYVKLKDNYYL